MIWLARKGLSSAGCRFRSCMYRYRQEVSGDVAARSANSTLKQWGLDLIIEACPPLEAVDPTLPPAARSAARKTEGLKLARAKHGFDGLITGIRRDEEPTRAKERVFSPRGAEGIWDVRDQPPEFWNHFNASPPPGAHLRIHPILHWTEADIWAYTRREQIPIIPLYLAHNGKRFTARSATPWISARFRLASRTRLDDRRDHRRTRRNQHSRTLGGRTAMDHESEDAFVSGCGRPGYL